MDASANLTFAGQPVVFNQTTYDDPTLCTLDTCPEVYASIDYVPNLGGNAFYLAWFAALGLVQLVVGTRYHTWTFMTAMLGGCILEVLGYAARVLMHENVFNFNWFLMYVHSTVELIRVVSRRRLADVSLFPSSTKKVPYLPHDRTLFLHSGNLPRLLPHRDSFRPIAGTIQATHLHRNLHHLRHRGARPASCRRRSGRYSQGWRIGSDRGQHYDRRFVVAGRLAVRLQRLVCRLCLASEEG